MAFVTIREVAEGDLEALAMMHSLFAATPIIASAHEPDGTVVDVEMRVADLLDYRMQAGRNDEWIAALAEQYRRHGFGGKPVQVEWTGPDTCVTDGNHRLTAAAMAGVEQIPTRRFAWTEAGRWAALRYSLETARQRDELIEAIADEDCVVLLALDDDRPAGVLVGEVGGLSDDERRASVRTLQSAPGRRGDQAHRMLAQSFDHWAQSRGALRDAILDGSPAHADLPL